MPEITAKLVKELRERTGEGMMACKKALIQANGSIEKAIDNMRSSGAIKAAKKANNITAEGSIGIKVAEDGTSAVMIEVNAQTDFLALQKDFKEFVESSLKKASTKEINSFSLLVKSQELERERLVAKTGENIRIRRLESLQGEVIGSYSHGGKIGALVSLKRGNVKLAKDIAMHIAASSPEFLSPSDVPDHIIQREKTVFLKLNEEKIKHKSSHIIDGMVKGRINKYLSEISLLEQNFIKDPSIKIRKLLEGSDAEIISFAYFKVGDGIEKTSMNFSEEVASQVSLARTTSVKSGE